VKPKFSSGAAGVSTLVSGTGRLLLHQPIDRHPGPPVQTLLPYCPDRGWKLDRGDGSWYSLHAAVFAGMTVGWDSVIQRIRDN
jgi:hypothetical protein